MLTQQIEHRSMAFPLQELLENANSSPHHVVKFKDVSRVILHLGDATEIQQQLLREIKQVGLWQEQMNLLLD